MQSDAGLFIAVEGVDGAGKTTQIALLIERLRQAGYDTVLCDFPRYALPSSYFITQYLNGIYGGLDEVGPYAASLFYALDRFDAAQDIRAALRSGKIVISDRFVGSNMAHQGAKIHNPEMRRGYFIWLDNLEFEMLRIPRPTLSVVLRIPVGEAQERIDRKEARDYTTAKRDLHEASREHLALTAAVYDELTSLFPRDFQAIDCMRGQELLDPAAIHVLLWNKIAPLLPDRPAKQAAQPLVPPTLARTTAGPQASVAATLNASLQRPAAPIGIPVVVTPGNADVWFYVPAQLQSTTRTQYIDGMKLLRTCYDDMLSRLLAHLQRNNPGWSEPQARLQAQTELQPVLPLATLVPNGDNAAAYELPAAKSAVAIVAEELLPISQTAPAEQVVLANYWPHNELDLVSDMLYEWSDLPLETIQRAVTKWPADKQAAILRSYALEHLLASAPSALDAARYTWNVVTDVVTLLHLQRDSPGTIRWQPASPRLGYAMPVALEQAGLSDMVEQCFDLSLQLYSKLQQAGFPQEAQYATLLGHRMRWRVTYNGREAFRLRGLRASPQEHPDYRKLLQQMRGQLAEAHPLITELMQFVSRRKDPDLAALTTERNTQFIPDQPETAERSRQAALDLDNSATPQ